MSSGAAGLPSACPLMVPLLKPLDVPLDVPRDVPYSAGHTLPSAYRPSRCDSLYFIARLADNLIRFMRAVRDTARDEDGRARDAAALHARAFAGEGLADPQTRPVGAGARGGADNSEDVSESLDANVVLWEIAPFPAGVGRLSCALLSKTLACVTISQVHVGDRGAAPAFDWPPVFVCSHS